MIKGVDVRPVANVVTNDVGTIRREFAYAYGKIAEISQILRTIYDKGEIDDFFRAVDRRPARVRRSTSFSPGGTAPIAFTEADFDAGGYFDDAEPEGLSFTFPGIFRIRGFVAWSGAAGTLQLRLNGTDVIAEGVYSVETMYSIKRADFIELVVDADVEGGLHSPVLEVEFVRPNLQSPRMG